MHYDDKLLLNEVRNRILSPIKLYIKQKYKYQLIKSALNM